ncbi:hypothetical protein IGI39_004024 [Enterococcus sp. AZ135]|uniref:hypothetical protein n=1 Tax=unclassified Enterococcus TaxID=2608891 RepID=UPI003F2148A0
MTDLELAGLITSLLPNEFREKLIGTLERFEKITKQIKAETQESNYHFCRYMEIYWLAVYNDRYEYSDLQKRGYSEWRKKAEEMRQRLQHKAVSA